MPPACSCFCATFFSALNFWLALIEEADIRAAPPLDEEALILLACSQQFRASL